MEDKERRSKEYLTEAEAAEFLGVAARTLRDWRRKGRVDGKGTKPPRAYVRGRHIYYAEDELDSWIREARPMLTMLTFVCGRRRDEAADGLVGKIG